MPFAFDQERDALFQTYYPLGALQFATLSLRNRFLAVWNNVIALSLFVKHTVSSALFDRIMLSTLFLLSSGHTLTWLALCRVLSFQCDPIQ